MQFHATQEPVLKRHGVYCGHLVAAVAAIYGHQHAADVGSFLLPAIPLTFIEHFIITRSR